MYGVYKGNRGEWVVGGREKGSKKKEEKRLRKIFKNFFCIYSGVKLLLFNFFIVL